MESEQNNIFLHLTCIYNIFIRKISSMHTKLTLNVDKTVIEQAKAYARSQKISLSRLIESYLASLISKERDVIEITPHVESLSGVVRLEKDYDVKKEYSDHLAKKHK